MKIFVTQKVLAYAGSEIYLLRLVPALRRQGIDVHFGLLCDDLLDPVALRYRADMEANNVPVYSFRLSKRPRPAELKAIAAHLRLQQYDLVHTHLLLADMAFALIKTLFLRKLRIVSTKHGYSEAYNNQYGFAVVKGKARIYRWAALWAERKILRSFAVSEALRKLFIGQGICDSSHIDVVYHGFDYEDVSPDPALRQSEQQICIVGRLTAFKGHRFALQMMPSVLAHFPEAKLIVVGQGSLEDELKRLATELNIRDNVIFQGFHSQPRLVMAASDVLVVPSVAEAFGLVILEGMSARVPIAAFDVPTPSEILKPGETALLAPPFAVERLAANVVTLLKDKELSQAIREKAYAVQHTHFTLQTMVENTVRFYNRALGR